ncbi:MFS transporter [Sphingomonas sp. KC8]|uniref:MFS transporter n=1 Tax=Sphingomonas sp. KC8 TaxID=1030157 RepID=UPI00024893BC|nr:MFS transporter [Sphingomonas sp. KC8]ARS27796.1 hypothetical protein KC8_10890 [Sphingomonas sp. KC8]
MSRGCGDTAQIVALACKDSDTIAASRSVSANRRAWLLVFVLSLIAFAIIGVTLTSLSVYLPVLQQEFGWHEAEMGCLPVAMLVGMSIGNLLSGRLMAGLGVRGAIAIGTAATGIGWAVASLSNTLAFFMGAMALTGCGAGIATIVPGVAAITRCFDARRGLAIGAFIGACALAGSIVPSISALLIAEYGWRATFLIGGSAIGAVCLPLAALIRISHETTSAGHSATDGASAGTTGPAAGDVAKLPAYWLLTAALTLSQLCMNGILFSIVAFFLRHGFAQDHAVTIYSATNLMALPGLFVGGALADRYGAKAALPGVLLLQAAGTLCLLGVTGSQTMGNGAAIAGFILLWGLAGGLPSQIGPMLLADLIGARAFATMLGVTLTITGLIGALAPVATGWLYDARGSYVPPIIICGLLTILAAFITLCVKRRD